MKKGSYSLSLLGVVLSAVLSQSTAEAKGNNTIQNNKQASRLLVDLMNRGYISVDPQTGKMILNSDVLSILQGYGLLDDLLQSDTTTSDCTGTGGGGHDI